MAKGSKWHPELCIDRTAVVRLYSSGLSTRQVGKILGYSPTYIARLCQEAGVARDRSTAARLRRPPVSKHWRSARQAARQLMTRELGRPLTTQEHVHHKDGDYTNNTLENLEILSPRAHAHRHHPPNPVPRSQRPERQAYARWYHQVLRKVPKVCPECGRSFLCDRFAPDATCSHRCGAKRHWRTRRRAS
jgi:hypothetical protein